MENLEEFKKLFPLKGKVTQEIIDEANVDDINECIGAKTLRDVLPEKYKHVAAWGATSGYVEVDDNQVCITTKKSINFMLLKEPRDVEFIFRSNKKL